MANDADPVEIKIDFKQDVDKGSKKAISWLDKLRNVFKKTKDDSEGLNASMDKAPSLLSKMGTAGSVFIGGALAGAVLKATQFFAQLLSKATDFILKGRDIALQAEGVENAFKRLDNPNLLRNLREATGGTVKDFDLMKAAVKADNFNIPVEKLGVLLKFAKQQAQATGESVDYLVDSMVTGLGRKSVMIMDNLQIDISELQSRTKATGDFMASAIDMIDEKLQAQGDLAVTKLEEETAATVQLENAQIRLGKRFEWLGNLKNKAFIWMADAIDKVAGSTESATEKFDNHINKIADLEVNMVPLVARYEELKTKGELNKEEQAELNRVMNSISGTIPGVISEFDQYGNVLSINTGLVYDYIDAEKARLQFVHGEAIDKLKKQREKLQAEYNKQQNIAKHGAVVMSGGGMFGGSSGSIDNRAETLQKAADKAQKIGVKLQGVDAELARLEGTALEEQQKKQTELLQKRAEFNAMNEKELKAWINDEKNAASSYIDIAKRIYAKKVGTDATPDPDPDDKSGDKAKKEAEEAARRAEKVNQLIQRVRDKNAQDEITVMEEHAEKKRRQIQLDYEREIEEIKRQEKEVKEAQGGELKDDQATLFDERKSSAAKVRDKSLADVAKVEADAEKKRQAAEVAARHKYLAEYGTYQEQRLAIVEMYAEKISEAENEWTKKTLTEERDQALGKLEQSMMEQTDLWIRLFADAEEHTAGFISETIRQVEELLAYLEGKEGATVPIGFTKEQLDALKKDPKEVQAVMDALIKQRDALAKKNPFGAIISGFKDLRKAGKDTEKQMAAVNKVMGGMEGVSSILGQVGSAMEGLGGKAGDTMGKVSEVMGSTMSMAQTGASVGGPWGAAAGAAIGLGTSLIKVFGGAKELSQETIEQYNNYMATIDELIGKQKELIASTAGSSAVAAAEEAKRLVEVQVKAARKMGEDYFNSGAGWFSKSHGVKMTKKIKAYANELSKIGVDVSKWGKRGTELFSLPIEQLEKIKKELPGLWASLDDSTRQYLDTIIDTKQAMGDIDEQQKESLAGFGFDELKNSLDELARKADLTFEDIGDSFEEKLSASVLNFVKNEAMQKELRAWYDKFSEYMGDGQLTTGEREELQREYTDLVTSMNNKYKELMEMAGIELDKESKIEGTKGTQVGASQDSVDALSGGIYAVRQQLGAIVNKLIAQDDFRQSLLDRLDKIMEHTEYLLLLEDVKKSLDVMVNEGVKMQ